MKSIRWFKAVAPFTATLLLCGCPTIHTRYTGQPERLAVPGTYVHSGSKIQMPERIGDFRREAVFRYDVDGFDVSAGYNLNTGSHHIAATVYVYPAPSLISIGSPPEVVAGARAHLTAREFGRRLQEIRGAHPGATLVEERDISKAAGGRLYPGKLAIFEYEEMFAGSRIPVRSRLYLYCYVGDKWAVKYRFTHPKTEQADQEIEDFIQAWNWYGEGV